MFVYKAQVLHRFFWVVRHTPLFETLYESHFGLFLLVCFKFSKHHEEHRFSEENQQGTVLLVNLTCEGQKRLDKERGVNRRPSVSLWNKPLLHRGGRIVTSLITYVPQRPGLRNTKVFFFLLFTAPDFISALRSHWCDSSAMQETWWRTFGASLGTH